jgi:hypothetical protein
MRTPTGTVHHSIGVRPTHRWRRSPNDEPRTPVSSLRRKFHGLRRKHGSILQRQYPCQQAPSIDWRVRCRSKLDSLGQYARKLVTPSRMDRNRRYHRVSPHASHKQSRHVRPSLAALFEPSSGFLSRKSRDANMTPVPTSVSP